MDFNSSNLFLFIYKWRKPLIIFPILAAIVAFIVSSPPLTQPLFRSSVVVFPSSTNSISKALLTEQNSGTEDVLEFGDEQQAEHLLQILNSDEIRDRIVEEFDLMNHYDIDATTGYPKTVLMKAYANRISFQRTQYQSVEIEVYDTDPVMAADIANRIAKLLDEVKKRIQKQRAEVSLKIVKGEYQRVIKEIEEREEKLKDLRKKGVQDYEVQTAVLNEQLAVAMMAGKSNAEERISHQLDTLSKYGGLQMALRDEIVAMKEEQMNLKVRLDQARVDVEQDLPATFIVNNAFAAERKSKPRRLIITVVAAAGVFLMTLMFILIVSTLKEAKEEKA